MTKPALRQLKGRNNLVGAEIGIGEGTHASFFLRELDIDLVFLIDPHTAYKDERITRKLEVIRGWEKRAHERLDGYKHKIRWIKEKSADATRLIANDSLDFVYIDGNHTHESVAEDIFLYYPKVKEGGLLSGHDYDYKSVKKAVDEFVGRENLKLHIEDMGPGQFSDKGKKYDWWIWKIIRFRDKK